MTERANAVEPYGPRPWVGLDELSALPRTSRSVWPRFLLRPDWIVAAVLFAAVFVVVARNGHEPLDIVAGPFARAVAGSAPLLAAAVAALAVISPWWGYLAILLLTPFWDAAQVSWRVGGVQVIAQTLFLVALGAGILLRMRSGGVPGPTDWLAALRAWRARPDSSERRVPEWAIAAAAVCALLALGWLSTVASPTFDASLPVFLHGVLEPAALGLCLVALRPDRRRLVMLIFVLALSVGLGALLNLGQTLPAVRSLATLQSQRVVLSRLTYFNVGLFGELLAMATPLILGGLALRRELGLGGRATALLASALALCVMALFITFSKSAWLATAGATVVLALLVVRGWRRRLGIVAITFALMTIVVPWPAYLLRPVAPGIAQTDARLTVALVGQSRFDSWNPATVSGRRSLVERLYATEAAFHMAIDHPLLGVGLDRFGYEYVHGYLPKGAHVALDSAHSFWPEVAAELGLPALALVVLIYLVALLAAWRAYRSPPDEVVRRLAATVLAGLVAWLVVATLFAGDMYRPWRNMSSDFVLMAVLVAAALALGRLAERRRTVSVPGERAAGGANARVSASAD